MSVLDVLSLWYCCVADADFCCGLQSPEDGKHDSHNILPNRNSKQRGPFYVPFFFVVLPLYLYIYLYFRASHNIHTYTDYVLLCSFSRLFSSIYMFIHYFMYSMYVLVWYYIFCVGSFCELQSRIDVNLIKLLSTKNNYVLTGELCSSHIMYIYVYI